MKKLQVKRRYSVKETIDFPFITEMMFERLGEGLNDSDVVDFEQTIRDRWIDFQLSTLVIRPSEFANIGRMIARLRARYPEDADIKSLLLYVGGTEK